MIDEWEMSNQEFLDRSQELAIKLRVVLADEPCVFWMAAFRMLTQQAMAAGLGQGLSREHIEQQFIQAIQLVNDAEYVREERH